MNLTKEELKSLVLEELQEMEELDEGFMDKMRMKFAGGKEKAGAYWKNLKRMGKKIAPELTGRPAGGGAPVYGGGTPGAAGGGTPGAAGGAAEDEGPIDVKRAGAKAGALKKLQLFQKRLEDMREDLFADLEHFPDITETPEVHKAAKDLGKQLKAAATAAKNLQTFMTKFLEE